VRALRLASWTLLALSAALAVALFVRERARPPLPLVATLPHFELTERDGSRVTLADLAGRPWIADFIFTRCQIACPVLTARMREVRGKLPPGSGIRSVSLTVDAGHDTPAVLVDYAAAFGIAGRDWLFLTDGPGETRKLVREGFLQPVVDTPENAAMPVLHSTRFALVDGAGGVRGFYDAYDPEDIERLVADALRLERSEAFPR
jgi:protein SCO1/2